MKRSEINRAISRASQFFSAQGFSLPPFADWTPDAWNQLGSAGAEIAERCLGWDVTDFSSGKFEEIGLTLFTLRNGVLPAQHQPGKCYAEKIMFVGEGQVTPLHHHALKTEDIINRGRPGAGYLAVRLFQAGPNGALSEESLFVSCDGIRRSVGAGETLCLGPGESITIPAGLWHTFQAVQGDALIGEVSSPNDDSTDNFFYEPFPRFPQIIEDEPRIRLLCTEYPGSAMAPARV